METVLILLAFVFLIGGPILSVIVLVQLSRMKTRVRKLEGRLRDTQQRERAQPSAAREPEPEMLPDDDLGDEAAPPTAAQRVVSERTAKQPAPLPAGPFKDELEDDEPAMDAPLSGKQHPGSKPKPKPKPAFDWERWIGVRGAAILGGVALALAGLFFFQHALTQGWIRPGSRVLTGAIVGSLCMLSKEVLQKRGYGLIGSVLAGAGAVILYGAAWSGARQYELFPNYVGFVWMIAVTAACVVLASRHRSQLIAVFGLVGGFATPLLLSTGQDRPISLFGYILLLDLAMLALARKRRWPLIGLLGIFGTTLIQGLWVFARMDPERSWLGLVILGVFAVVFAIAGRGVKEGAIGWVASQIASVLLPFVMAFYFASSVDLGPNLWPVAALCGLLGVASYWIAKDGNSQLPIAATLGTLGIVGVWVVSRDALLPAHSWEYLWVACGLVVMHLAAAEWTARNAAASAREAHTWIGEHGAAVGILAAGLSLVYGLATAERGNGFLPFWPSALLAPALAALGIFAVRRPRLAAFPLLTGFAAGLVLFGFHNSHALLANEGYPGNLVFRLALLGTGAVFLLAGRMQFAQATRSWILLGALACLLLPVIGLIPPRAFEPHIYLGTTLGIAAICVLASIWARSQWGYAATVFAIGIAAVSWRGNFGWDSALPFAGFALAWHAAIAGLLALAPAVMRAGLSSAPNIWRVASVAPLLWFSPNLFGLFREWQEGWLVLLPLGLGTICAAGFALESAHHKRHGLERYSAGYVWYGISAAFFAGFAPAILVDIHWMPVGCVAVGLMWSILAAHTQRPKLRSLAAVALTCGTLALIALASTPVTFERSDSLVFNQVSYIYLAPFACLLLALRFMRPANQDDEHIARWCSAATGLSAVALVFVWLNLEVLNAFTTTEHLHVRIEPDAGRNLSHSVAWTAYSLALLAIGTLRRASGPRWMSLVFLLATIAKVFLYDLRELEGLYRAGSMLGLALCLLIVSALYQRFVFRKPEAD